MVKYVLNDDIFKDYCVIMRLYVTGFARRGLIHASNFSNLTRHNSAYSAVIASKFCGMNFTTLDNTVTKFELDCFTTH